MRAVIEADFRDFEESLESLEERALERISEKITQKFFNDVYIKACERMATKVDEVINQALEAFLQRQIVVTDRWGDPKKHTKMSTKC